jgi:hypothetical protein
MILRHGPRWLAGLGLVAAAFLSGGGLASAQAPCATCPTATYATADCYHCQRFHCPPHHKHCLEGPPRICFQRGCPKPICNPCTTPNWGYHQTCWTPWPWPPDWSHCPVQPPAAVVFPGLMQPGAQTDSELPPPRKVKSGI